MLITASSSCSAVLVLTSTILGTALSAFVYKTPALFFVSAIFLSFSVYVMAFSKLNKQYLFNNIIFVVSCVVFIFHCSYFFPVHFDHRHHSGGEYVDFYIFIPLCLLFIYSFILFILNTVGKQTNNIKGVFVLCSVFIFGATGLIPFFSCMGLVALATGSIIWLPIILFILTFFIGYYLVKFSLNRNLDPDSPEHVSITS